MDRLEKYLEQAAKKPQSGPALWDTQSVKDAYEAGFREGRGWVPTWKELGLADENNNIR